MTTDDVRSILDAEPFVPLRLFKMDGLVVHIPYRHVAVFVRGGLLIFKGVSDEKSHAAKGYEVVGYDRIARIEPKGKVPARRRRRSA